MRCPTCDSHLIQDDEDIDIYHCANGHEIDITEARLYNHEDDR